MRLFWLLSDLVQDHVNVILDKPNCECDSNILQVDFDLRVFILKLPDVWIRLSN